MIYSNISSNIILIDHQHRSLVSPWLVSAPCRHGLRGALRRRLAGLGTQRDLRRVAQERPERTQRGAGNLGRSCNLSLSIGYCTDLYHIE